MDRRRRRAAVRNLTFTLHCPHPKAMNDSLPYRSIIRASLFGLLCLLCSLSAGCDLPRDPDGTLARVRGGVLRVGIVENYPWASLVEGAPPQGVEVKLIEEFASELDARPEWIGGGEQAHMEALEAGELDIVIGGVTTDSPWVTKVGVTRPYFESRTMIGTTGGASFDKLDGVRVLVHRGSLAASQLEAEGATPVRVDDPFRVEPDTGASAVAAEDWELERHGFTLSEFDLHTNEHIIAIARGENGFLMRLERFLAARRDRVRKMLKTEGVITERIE